MENTATERRIETLAQCTAKLSLAGVGNQGLSKSYRSHASAALINVEAGLFSPLENTHHHNNSGLFGT